MSSIFQLVYVSTTSKSFEKSDISEILERARRKNAAANISGVLLFADNDFIQVLEGPKEAVQNVFTAIRRDPRHAAVLVLLSRAGTCLVDAR